MDGNQKMNFREALDKTNRRFQKYNTNRKIYYDFLEILIFL